MFDYTPISANTIFHFTKDLEGLLDILRWGFFPRYCLEEQRQFGIEDVIAIPMISFCDIPLSQIRNHVKHYGKYAIGLSKEWGIKNKISPIMYTIPNAISSEMIRNSFNMLLKHSREAIIEQERSEKHEVSDIAKVANRQYEFLSYVKAYEGRLIKDGKFEEEIIRYYDEREWRYVPLFEDMMKSSVPTRLSRESYCNKEIRSGANNLLKNYFNLTFLCEDIRYIIIEEDKDILNIVCKIDDLKDRFTRDERNILKTRIISMDKILDDF